MTRNQRKQAVMTVFGDASPASMQYASNLEGAYYLFCAAMFAGAGQTKLSGLGGKTKKLPSKLELTTMYTKTVPGFVFTHAASIGWIPYYIEGEINKEYEGKTELGGFYLKDEFVTAFMSLLPIEELSDMGHQYLAEVSQKETGAWATNPKTLIDGFVTAKRTKNWLAIQMEHKTPLMEGRQTKWAYLQYIKNRRKEPELKVSQKIDARGRRQAELLVKIFQNADGLRYADLKPEHFYWIKKDE